MNKFRDAVIGGCLWMFWGAMAALAGLRVDTKEFWMVWAPTIILTVWYTIKTDSRWTA